MALVESGHIKTSVTRTPRIHPREYRYIHTQTAVGPNSFVDWLAVDISRRKLEVAVEVKSSNKRQTHWRQLS